MYDLPIVKIFLNLTYYTQYEEELSVFDSPYFHIMFLNELFLYIYRHDNISDDKE